VAVPDSDRLPCGRCSEATPAELLGSGARSTQSVAQAAFHAIARGGKGYPKPISLGHLLSRARGDAGWRGRHTGTPFDVPFTNPPGYGCHARFPEQTPLEPVRTCFREARPPRKPCFRGAFQGPEPPLIHLREEMNDTPHSRCLPSRGNQSSADMRSASRAPPRDRRWGPRSSATDAAGWFGRFSTGCSQPVNRRPAPLRSPDAAFSLTGGKTTEDSGTRALDQP
jgi:hypothetical protein